VGMGAIPGQGPSLQSGSKSASSLCGGGRHLETYSSLSHITFRPISLSRSDPVPGFVRSRQRFVRLSQASVGLDQWALQRSQEER
jgi:hypothetical protein